MPPAAQDACTNRLLRLLSPADFDLLHPHLTSTPLALGDVLIEPDAAIDRVHFVESGIVSLIAVAADGQQIELTLVGREGMAGVPVLLDADRTPNEGRVQARGSAWSMPSDALRAALRRSPVLHDGLLRYAQAVNVQVASTVLSNARYRLDQRLARWLLMCHDRVNGDVVPTTHRFLSLMLGVNRPGLTAAVATFERAALIETRRGNITIRDRGALLTIAGASYGVPEAEYERLIGRSIIS